jgi:NDP-sugar pyrophosphorylase family protein
MRARIGAGTSVTGKTVIGPHCVVGANVTLKDCILEDGVVIGNGATLTGVILDDGVKVESDCVVTVPAVFASGSLLAKGTRIVSENAASE